MYAYDGDRLASSAPEAEWDETERAWMVALQRYRNSLCPLCGGPADECMDIENELKFRAGAPIRCHRTTQRNIKAEQFRSDKTMHPEALVFPVDLV